MGFPVYDYRTDLRNVLVTPQIRSRFLRIEPGGPAAIRTRTTSGTRYFWCSAAGPSSRSTARRRRWGRARCALPSIDQPHAVRALGDEPMTMYLSVTPHIQPTHTTWTEDGQRMPFRFAPSANYDVDYGEARPLEYAD